MKKFLPFLLLLISVQFAMAQVTTPVVKANFGVDGDVTANYLNGSTVFKEDDWYSRGYRGNGVFVIDTTGAAAIVAGYSTNPATRGTTFSRLMRQNPYDLVNNMLLLDAVFHRDFHGDDSTVFALGSNKNGMSPAMWSCPVSQGIPDKNDILDAFTHVRRAGPNVTDSLWMFAGVSIENTSGNRYFDLELYQTDIAYDRTNQTFSGYGSDDGHTSWTFDAAGNIETPGDMIFTAEFGSAGLTLVEGRIWVPQWALSLTPATFNWGGKFDGGVSGAAYGYASILPKVPGDFYTGLQNAAATWAGPFALVRVDDSVLDDYIPNQFMEFSVNLTKLGIDPALFSDNPCGSPFRRVLIKSRASTSFTAALKDFVAPYKMFNYPLVDASTYITYFCGSVPNTTISISNPFSSSVYTWSTTNGHIVGASVGPQIIIEAPGTYRVSQQLHSACPASSVDTVAILFTPICMVLDVNINGLKANRVGKEAVIQWKANNNEQALRYNVEYSTDNREFKKLATVTTNGKSGTTDYSYRYQSSGNEPVIFYRVSVVGEGGVTKYSNTVLLKPINGSKNSLLIFPNPAAGDVWMSLESTGVSTANVTIADMAGRSVKQLQITLKKGSNLIPLQDLDDQMAGIYIIRVKTIEGEITQKLILKK